MTMTYMSLPIKTIADLDKAVPGLSVVWRKIKQAAGTTIRVPKTLVLRDAAASLCLNDGEMARRYALDLATMALGGERQASSGEWAVHAGPNNDREVTDVPSTSAMVEFTWHEYYRYATLTLQVAPGALPQQLQA